ncbi:T9SS type A sorting domain-containing protein [bacterium]|nr:T9SS type A sorting domain-containing protein [bacterium]
MKYVLPIFLLLCTPLFATTIHVPMDYQSIQTALYNTNPGDTVLVADGIYTENLIFPDRPIVLGSNYLLDGDLDHRTTTIIESPVPGTTQTILLNHGQDTTTVIAGFTIRHGSPGILCLSASPLIRNNIISENVNQSEGSIYGCGIALDSSSAVIRENHIHHNYPQYYSIYRNGGGIGAKFSDPTIAGNLIEYNGDSGSIYLGVPGGGIYLYRSGGQVLDNHIRYNKSIREDGGGISSSYGSAYYRGNLIEYNSAWSGGGIYLTNEDESILHENTIRYNEAIQTTGNGRGGGISILGGEPIIGTPEHRINLYENRSNFGHDLHKGHYTETLTLYADTVTIVREDPRYYNREVGQLTLHSLNPLYPQLGQHGTVYVSPDGDDTNFGTTPETAVRSLEVASRLIPYDGIIVDTIRLTEGVFQFDQTTLPRPLSLYPMQYVLGSGRDRTIIESVNSPVFLAELHENSVLRSLTIRGVPTGVLISHGSASIDSVSFEECGTAIEGDQASGSITRCNFESSGSARQEKGVLHLANSENLILDQCSFINNLSIPIVTNQDEAFSIRRSLFRNNTGAIYGLQFTELLISNCLIVGNDGEYPPIYLESTGGTEIVNCTIINNTATYGEAAGIFMGNVWEHSEVINSIVYYNRVGDLDTQIDYQTERDSLEVTYTNIENGYPGHQNFQDIPMFDNEETWELASNSIQIDAGNTFPVYHDIEDPDHPGYALYPSQGMVTNDLGAYGGPSPLQPVDVQTAVNEDHHRDPGLIKGFRLADPYPNPFNAQVVVAYELDKTSDVRVHVFDLLGREVINLAPVRRETGRHSFSLNGRHLPSGVYLLRMQADGTSQSRKLVLIK